MKKIMLTIFLSTLGFGLSVTANASFYPAETQELCKSFPSNDMYSGQGRIKYLYCLMSQNAYLDSVEQQTYKKLLAEAKNKQQFKKKWERDGEEDDILYSISEDLTYADFKKQLQGKPDEATLQEIESTLQQDQGLLINRIFGMEASALPKVYRTSKNPKKLMEDNYKKALAKSTDKADLEAGQKEWLAEREMMCYSNHSYGTVFGQMGKEMSVECGNNWNRIRAAQLAELAKAK